MHTTEHTQQEYHRPLVVRMGAMGDMVMLTPLLRRLYQRTGMKSDLVVCGEWNRILFAQCPWVNNIYSVTSRNAPYWFNKSKRLLVKTLRQSNENRPWFMLEHLPGLYKLMDRANYKQENGLTTAKYPRQIGEHTCEQFSRMVNSEHAQLKTVPTLPDHLHTELHVAPQDIEECKHWLHEKHGINLQQHKIVMIQAGNKKTMRKGKRDRDSNIKYWPEENWAQLILKIAASDPHTKILLCGAPSEVDLCNDILQACSKSPYYHQILQVADDLPLKRLLGLATIAHACISVDTGPAHVTAALGCPLVVLFGKSDPRQFRPLGINDVQVVTAKQWQNFKGSANEWAEQNTMDGITVDMAFEHFSNLMPRTTTENM